APSESVVATYMATTYFSHDMEPPAPPAKPGQPAAGKGEGERYETDDWNSFTGDSGRKCRGAEPGHHREHAQHDEGGRAEESDRLERSAHIYGNPEACCGSEHDQQA